MAYAWAGTFATTPDGLPYVGTHAKYPRTWFALGYGGNGITFSVVAANQALRLVARRAGSDPVRVRALNANGQTPADVRITVDG